MTTRRHWHMGQWIDGERRVTGYAISDDTDGLHGSLVERYGAYAYPLDVPGDPRRWVCHWACTDADVR